MDRERGAQHTHSHSLCVCVYAHARHCFCGIGPASARLHYCIGANRASMRNGARRFETKMCSQQWRTLQIESTTSALDSSRNIFAHTSFGQLAQESLYTSGHSIVVSTPCCGHGNRGSNPRVRSFFHFFSYANSFVKFNINKLNLFCFVYNLINNKTHNVKCY